MSSRRSTRLGLLMGIALAAGLGAGLNGAGATAGAPPSGAPLSDATMPAVARALASRTVSACSAGLVALTFDDGPSAAVTPGLVRLLEDRRVPATFFMVGERVAAAPATARLVSRHGFQVANHSYHHALMTSQSTAAVRGTLRSTATALRSAGAVPSGLMRPPYGGIDDRVRAAVRSVGLVPVLWDVDSRDWEGGSSAAITRSVLGQLRPHARNIVLQHDGVTNSPASVAAVPSIVRTARARGYCFTSLGPGGRPVVPVPRASLRRTTVREGQTARVVVRLDRPTSRPTRVRLTTSAASATAGRDYRGVARWVRFETGQTRAVIRVAVREDRLDEPVERFRVRLGHPSGLTLGHGLSTVRIADNDPAPSLTLLGTTVSEPLEGTTEATIRVTLDHVSGRRVGVRLRSVAGTATEEDFIPLDRMISFDPGTRTVDVPVWILADALDEPEEFFRVTASGLAHARASVRTALITIRG